MRVIDFIPAGVFLSCAVVWGASGELTTQAGYSESGELVYGGYPRTYAVHVPPIYDGRTPIPLVLSFHGRFGTGPDQARLTHLDAVADRYGFLVVYPDGIPVDRSWNTLQGSGYAEALGVNDVGFTDTLIRTLSARFTIDATRVYASGMSNGGFMSQRLGCELGTRIAAIASVSGLMATALGKICQPREPQPVMIIQGTGDPVVPFMGGTIAGGGSSLSAAETAETWRQLNACSLETTETLNRGQVVCRSFKGCHAPVTLCTVQNGGHTWPGGEQYLPVSMIGATNYDIDASDLTWQFFVQNRKPAAPSGLRISGAK